MNIEQLRDFALSLSDDIEERFPFQKFKAANGILVFYTCGHTFLYIDVDNFETITVKCQPDRIVELKEHYDGVVRPVNFNPKYWIGIRVNDVPDDLILQLVRNSFALVKAKYQKLKTKD